MDLQLFRDLQGGKGVEESIKQATRRMNPEDRLDVVMGVVGMGLEGEERLRDVVVEAWELVVKEEWWKARYNSFKEFTSQSGVSGGVAEMIRRRERTSKRKRRFEARAAKLWGGDDLVTILGPELMPRPASKGFLEAMKVLAKRVPNSTEAIKLLSAARDYRLRQKRKSKGGELVIGDVEAVRRGLEIREKKLLRTIEPSDEVEGPVEHREKTLTPSRGFWKRCMLCRRTISRAEWKFCEILTRSNGELYVIGTSER